ncbi:MAG: ribonuclease HI family protein [Euryarchaeota archaeon]|nr:ribonuclease HI family protein [Euryarchaeota archaeon]
MKKIQFDGGARPNPGEMGIGAVLIENSNIITEISKKLPDCGTNNIAEYMALLAGISKALELGWKHVMIEGDSELVINQVNGAWKINKEHLKSLYAQVVKELSKFDSYTINWIPREKNSIADELASKALGYKENCHHHAEIENKATGCEKDIGIKCPKCKRDCVFKWQVFKNGSRHIRQECPVHGHIKYAPKIEPYLTIANQTKDKTTQKKLF